MDILASLTSCDCAPFLDEDSVLFQKSLDDGSLNIKIASVLFVGRKDSALSDAKHVIFQEPISGITPVSSHIKHEIYFRIKGDPMIQRLQPESCDSLILHSMGETTTGVEHAVVGEASSTAVRAFVEETSTTVGHTFTDMTTGEEHAPHLKSEFSSDAHNPSPQPTQDITKPPVSSQSSVIEQVKSLDQEPNPISESQQLSYEFLDEAGCFKDLTKLLKDGKNKGMVEFFHVCNVGSCHHMNEILQIFVKNVSLCALVIDSSEATIHKQEIEMLHEMSYASKAMVIEMCSDGEPSLENLASKNASLEHLSNVLVESSSDPPNYIFPVTLRLESDPDNNVGTSLLAHALSSPSTRTFPFSWYLFGFRLRLLMISRNHSAVTVSHECMAIAKGLKMDRSTVETALEHLMDHNIILYFRNILSDAVFLDVQVFSQVLETLFEKYTHYENRYGSFNQVIFYEVVANLLSNSVSSEQFFTLFSELMIIAPFNYGATKSYFIPSWLTVLNEKDRKETCSTSADSHFSPLLYECPSNGFEFITMLTAFLLNQSGDWKILRNSKGNPECLHKNCVKFNFEDRFVVTISFFSGYIEVYVKLEKPMQSLHDVSSAVLRGLENVVFVLNSHKSYSFDMAFPCHCGRFEHIHTAPYNSDTGTLECLGRSVRIDPSSPIMAWLKDNKSGMMHFGVD
jgi:hypothetical protein